MSDEVFDFTDSPLNNWLLNHKNFIKFIRINSAQGKKQNEQGGLKSTIKKLKKFYENAVVLAKPAKPLIPRIHRNLNSSCVFLARQHFFLQNEIYLDRCKAHQGAEEIINELTEALEKIAERTNSVFVDIDEQSMMWELFADPPFLDKMLNKDSCLVTDISSNEPIFSDISNQANHLRRTLFEMRPYYDRKSMSIPENILQEKLEQLIFSDNFVFSKEIKDAVDTKTCSSPSEFTQKSVALLEKISEELEISDEIDKIILQRTLFRAVFNTAMCDNEVFFFPPCENDFRRISQKLTLKDLAINMNFVPKHEEGETLVEIAMKSERIMKAAAYLTETSFSTTPLDVLSSVHFALSELKLYAVENATDKTMDDAYTFDCIFGLFLLALSVSDLPNTEEVFAFAKNFVPIDSLSGPMEYANATVTAAQEQCRKFVEKFK